jgi:xylulokinase
VTRDAAAETGLRAGTPVAAGTIDAWAEAVSVGVRRPGELMLMYGSTMFLVQVTAAAARHPKLWGTVGVERGSRCLAAGMATSGTLTSWLRDLVGVPPYEQLLAEAGATPAGADGLVVLPYFAGERTPLFDPRARGVVCGLTLSHGRGHIYRALLEGTAYGVCHNLETMQEAGAPPRRNVAVGGGTQGDLWPQIVSDVTGRAQEVPRYRRGASYGDALLAARAVGLVAEEADWCEIAAVIEPDPTRRERYDELYAAYRELYPATRATVHALAELQERDT